MWYDVYMCRCFVCVLMCITVVSFVFVYTCGICTCAYDIFACVFVYNVLYAYMCVTMNAYVYLSHYSIAIKTHYDKGNSYKKHLIGVLYHRVSPLSSWWGTVGAQWHSWYWDSS